jgi:uncharacterized membrane protein
MPSPVHPALVHFPIVFMLLLPLIALGTLWAIRRGMTVKVWRLPVVAALALSLSSWIAVETGEGDEERVEEVVGETALNVHEEAAERFLLMSGAVAILLAAGLLRGRLGGIARVAGTVAALGLVAAGYQVGHSGGRLVYGDGTTRGISAISPAGTAVPSETGSESGEDHDND